MHSSRQRFPAEWPRVSGLALALAWAVMSPAHAGVTITGYYWTDPGGINFDDGNWSRPDVSVWMVSAPSSFSATGGAKVDLAAISMGGWGGVTHSLVSGPGTRLKLHAGRLYVVGGHGTGTLTVENGAEVIATASPGECYSFGKYHCNSAIGAGAGSNSTLTVTGSGSLANFAGLFGVGLIGVPFGVAGGHSTGTVKVLDGAKLRTQLTTLGSSGIGTDGLPSQRSRASLLIDGLLSTWHVDASNAGPIEAAQFFLASGPRATATLDVQHGGRLLMEVLPGRQYDMLIGAGGEATAVFTGPGSRLNVTGDSDKGSLLVGHGSAGTLKLLDNAQLLTTARSLFVGLGVGADGTLRVEDKGTRADFREGHLVVGQVGKGAIYVGAPTAHPAMAKAWLSAGAMTLAVGDGMASVTFEQAAQVDLTGSGQRFTVGHWGEAKALVSTGALLDASSELAGCHICTGAAVGVMAGSKAEFEITGGGSRALFIGDFVVGGVGVNASGGLLGGATEAKVSVRDGGFLRTERVSVGGWASPGGNGDETSFSALTVTGPESKWLVTGSDSSYAIVSSGTHVRGTAEWQVTNKGQLLIGSGMDSRREAHLRLAHGGGRTTMLVNDRDSLLKVAGEVASINVGENGGFGQLIVGQGAKVELSGKVFSYMNIGMPGSEGEVYVVSGSTLSGVQRMGVGIGGKGRLEVLEGAWLETEGARVAAAMGSNRSVAHVHVRDHGSLWTVMGGAADNGAALLLVGEHYEWSTFVDGVTKQSDIRVTGGGGLLLAADPDKLALVDLGATGGVHDMAVSGTDSSLQFSGSDNAHLQIGRNRSQSSFVLNDGGSLLGFNRIAVGDTQATGRLEVHGPETRAESGDAFANLSIGVAGGTGIARVGGGASMYLSGRNSTGLHIADGSGSWDTVGSLEVMGASSRLTLETVPTAPGANPVAQIGRGGSATVQITDGGVLSLQGGISSTLGQANPTLMNIGMPADKPGSGSVLVSGPGSLLSVLGTDAGIRVGLQAGGSGQVNVAAGGELRTTAMVLGSLGGTGRMVVDGGQVRLLSQWTGQANVGARLVLGEGGSGSVEMRRGAVLGVLNAGSAGAALWLGGTPEVPLGDGTLTLDEGSRLVLDGGSGGKSVAVLGYEGTAMMTLRNGSRLHMPGGELTLAARGDSTGELWLHNGSRVEADYVGVGLTRGRPEAGGCGRVMVFDTSVLKAGTLEMGVCSFLGGSGTIEADVDLSGVLAPGNSPGALTIAGSLVTRPGARIELEVQSDGSGGFLLDELVLADGSALNLAGAEISFRFVGGTDPRAFQAGGRFLIDSFFARQSGAELSHGAFAAVSFTASADAYRIESFSFTADGGATFTATPVPEPGSWLLMLAGLCALCIRKKGRQVRCS